MKKILFIISLFIFNINASQLVKAHHANCGISSAHPLATSAGCLVLKKGGNAFDAAVAVTSTLAVVEPFSSGIGGGGFYLLHINKDNHEVFLDARETAPTKANPVFFVKDGAVNRELSLVGPTAAGIPGIPAAIDVLANKYGNLSLIESMMPAIDIAQNGFKVDKRFRKLTEYKKKHLIQNPDSSKIFLRNGEVPPVGAVLRQVDLANTMRLISEKGSKVFYKGELAEKMVDEVNQAGGLWTAEDLENYTVIEREPLRFTFKGANITTAPLPSSGGLVMAQVFNIIKHFSVENMDETDLVHLIIEAMRRGYSDRAYYMGDPDFNEIPEELLLSERYFEQKAMSIELHQASKSSDLNRPPEEVPEGRDTTHFSIIDDEGNMVSATLSINGPFGAAFTVAETGILLNNHINDFVLKPGLPNMYGLIGQEANLVGAGKRPLSSMSPSFVEDERGVLVIGTPGGSRIISMVILGILDYLFGDIVDLTRIVSLPRYHHQFIPDRVEIEPEAFSEDWVKRLNHKGHVVKVGNRRWGNMQLIFFDKKSGIVNGASDPRGNISVYQ